MILNYKYEIFPEFEQKEKLNTWISWCRHTYNSALLDKQRNRKSRNELQKIQVQDKKKYAFLKEMPSQPLQEVFSRLEKSFEKFYRKESRYPKIKSFKNYHSITFPQFGIGKQFDKKYNKLRTVRRAASLGHAGKLLISGLGLIDIHWHRNLDGKVKQLVIKRQGSRWYAIFSVERQANPETLNFNKTTGIDVGIHYFAVLSNGEKIPKPKLLEKSERKLKKTLRQLSKCKKGSKNRLKRISKLHKIHEKLANQRRDFLHKQSYRIAKHYSVVCVEDLKISNIKENRHLSKFISDVGWGTFRSFLEYKCEKNGGVTVKVKPNFVPQNCSKCETLMKKSLSIRTHICAKCGTILDREHNAAINIENEGLKQFAALVR